MRNFEDDGRAGESRQCAKISGSGKCHISAEVEKKKGVQQVKSRFLASLGMTGLFIE
jgi:hypothetical protein